MNDRQHSWRDDFPIMEEVEDFRGRSRLFEITCHERPQGFALRAVESGTADDGYAFAAYSETSPYNGLYRLRQKIARGLATRHLSGGPGDYQLTHGTLSGRITCEGIDRPVLIVDGIPLTLEEFARILASHEGWDFRLNVIDSLE